MRRAQLCFFCKAPLPTLSGYDVVGGGGGAGYVGGAGALRSGFANVPPGPALAGSSFLAASVNGACTGLAGNSGNGYVNVYVFL